MSSAEPYLAGRGVAYAYRAAAAGRGALAGVDLAVAPGEVVGLLGPNGSGKSTLLRILAGVLPDYAGEVTVGGDELRTIPRRELARRVALVPQESSYGVPFTALEVVLLGRHPHLSGQLFESAHDVERAHDALRRCGAEHLAQRRVHALSSGERQRVVVARALAQEPRALLLDEAGSFLDIRHQVALFDLVREIAAAGTAVVAVLHDLNLAGECCDRLVLLRDGAVAAAGPTSEVLTYAILRRVFDTDIYVDSNDLTGGIVVAPLTARARRALAERSVGAPGPPAGPRPAGPAPGDDDPRDAAR